jgi:hypothetical protein
MTGIQPLGLAIAALGLWGCATASVETGNPVALPTARERPDIHLTALLAGTVILDDGCLYVGEPGGPRRYVIWPYGTRLETSGGRRVLVNGRTRLAVGDAIALGGGSFPADAPDAFAFVDPPPPARCVGAGEEVFGASTLEPLASFERRHRSARN